MARNKDNLNDLKTSGQLKTDLLKMKKELDAAYKTINKIIKDNKGKEDEIAHLKKLLEQNVPVLVENKKIQKTIQFEIPAEEEIAEIQLHMLREDARKRKLTLEEVRQYDLLVKNKRISQEVNSADFGSGPYRDVDDASLLAIAESPIDKNTDKK